MVVKCPYPCNIAVCYKGTNRVLPSQSKLLRFVNDDEI